MEQPVQLIFTIEGAELVPPTKTRWNLICANFLQEREADSGVVRLLVIEPLPKKVGFGSSPHACAWRGGFVIGGKPPLRCYNKHAGGFIDAVFAPLWPTHIRTAGVLFETKLVKCNGYVRLPQQLAKPSDGASVLRRFVTVTDEDLLQHN